ncbi:endonuclease/exonuclease/phosphatase family protein [Pedobacter frigiditerrae]|uniref:endonuclease/exonuclease/phosphatase family protein n=1 Tax=Pedobacter frigiditerrae TaxID=2530452 RepID=UPI00292FE64F|nr:endonuclease/exonuclease/phosphatase family protein [Pedobacter frigiditerrae]
MKQMHHLSRKLIFLFTAILFCACSAKISSNLNAQTNTGLALKVMTYNIHHANPPSKPGLIDLDAIAAVIKKENPDLVGLQEVDCFTKRSGNIDEAKVLAEKTGMHFQFFKAIDHDGGDYGVAILSKFPLQNGTKVDLPQVIKAEARVLSYATVTLPNKTKLIFANTHLDATRPDSNRVVQMKSILSALSLKKEAIILVGDLNCEARAEPIILLDQQYKRSCTASCAHTIPQDFPKKTIDYIALKNANWNVSGYYVIPETYASDHRPVVSVYQVK